MKKKRIILIMFLAGVMLLMCAFYSLPVMRLENENGEMIDITYCNATYENGIVNLTVDYDLNSNNEWFYINDSTYLTKGMQIDVTTK